MRWSDAGERASGFVKSLTGSFSGLKLKPPVLTQAPSTPSTLVAERLDPRSWRAK
jgi:hypothetical protein